MRVRVLSIALLSLVLTACSSDDDDATFVDVFTDGGYNITAPSTTVTDRDGGTCGDGTGTLNLSDGDIIGTVSSSSGLVFDVSGTVDAQGVVAGGFALSGQVAANFQGQFTGETGSGTWEDTVGCEGTWSASLVTE